MFWADKVVHEIEEQLKERINTHEPLVVRDEKTASGRVHVGAMRTVSIHGLISYVLKERTIKNIFRYEINDFDAFDTVPAYVPAELGEHLGKPLYKVPSPEEGYENYAQYFGEQYLDVVRHIGIEPDVYYSSDQYKKGAYNEVIKTALTHSDQIRDIYKDVSGGAKEGDWLPIMMVCEQCGRVATTRPVSFDGERVSYVCDQEAYEKQGCGYKGNNSPFDGNAKLPWKVEWAAKFKVFDVSVEGEGKDLATKGGARDVANHISREVFKHEPPFDVPHEFFLIGGKKMSTSKGTGASAVEVSELMPAHIFRLALIGKEPKRAFDFDPEGDTLSLLYDRYDAIAQKYWNNQQEDDARLFELIYFGNPPERHFLPRFSQVAFLSQMPHLSLEEEVARMKGTSLTGQEKEVLEERATYARDWLEHRADEKYIYKLQTDAIPEATQGFSEVQKSALRALKQYVDEHEVLDGEMMHKQLHAIKESKEIAPKELFSAIYLAFLGRESGPQAGWFLSVLPRDFLLKRLEEVS